MLNTDPHIKVGWDGCGRFIPEGFKQRLAEYNRHQRFPIKLIWNPTGKEIQRAGIRNLHEHDLLFMKGFYEQRWEIWVLWDQTTHPDKTERGRKGRKQDVQLHEDGLQWIRVGPYTEGAGAKENVYADPFDGRFWASLEYADSWNRRQLKHSGDDAHFMDIPEDVEQRGKINKELVNLVSQQANYYRGLDNPIVGGHRGRYSKADWRHRLPHR